MIALALLGAALAVEDEGEWTFEPIVTVSAVVVEGRTSLQAIGGGALRYRRLVAQQGRIGWISTSRFAAIGIYSLNTGSYGADLRVGTFIGPQIERFRYQVGPDVFFDFYGTRSSTDYHLPPSPGLAIRNQALYDFGPVVALLEAAPAWLLIPERRVDGLGPLHQLSVLGAVRIQTDVVQVQVGYQRVWTSAGVQDGIVFGGGI